MTKEQAIEFLQTKSCVNCSYGAISPRDCLVLECELKSAINMAIKALEQQPSDDCVSRKAVLDMAKSYNTDGWDSYTPLVVDVEDIEQLPPVTPAHGTCKDCNNCGAYDCGYTCYKGHWSKISTKSNYGGMGDFYCGDFEKRGNENEIN